MFNMSDEAIESIKKNYEERKNAPGAFCTSVALPPASLLNLLDELSEACKKIHEDKNIKSFSSISLAALVRAKTSAEGVVVNLADARMSCLQVDFCHRDLYRKSKTFAEKNDQKREVKNIETSYKNKEFVYQMVQHQLFFSVTSAFTSVISALDCLAIVVNVMHLTCFEYKAPFSKIARVNEEDKKWKKYYEKKATEIRRIQQIIRESGPDNWFSWCNIARNKFRHEGRPRWPTKVAPTGPEILYSSLNREVRSFAATYSFPATLSDSFITIADGTIDEPVSTTVIGIIGSVYQTVDAICSLIREQRETDWHARAQEFNLPPLNSKFIRFAGYDLKEIPIHRNGGVQMHPDDAHIQLLINELRNRTPKEGVKST